ncbi:MAG: tRNA (adenosine(37)-N6)-threonylcarbamoyltransferase complex ATPase subunit type 1 TsaE [Patescibacteria group bacterium]|nr:MAG: tRNA (adenosine(37)-N6)-threonylcarbamoyltransferase complex ATPase subunit type 1 TsaE [Patescibacteria group bacterium]WKZ24828.1 MAG: tRNA (adenosine(37)-N6)-threonylcarbamoyltransferase complex ATPase subunit type 1 TsaE [Patescibacteria group bacterium]
MKKIIKVLNSEAETKKFGQELAKSFKGGEVIGLIGELGAGKTSLVKGLALGLGVKKNITSPTFIIMNIYKVKHEKIKNLVHVDAYRIKKGQALLGIGLGDYLGDPQSITIIEWADLVPDILNKKVTIIKLKHLGGDKRKISINY